MLLLIICINTLPSFLLSQKKNCFLVFWFSLFPLKEDYHPIIESQFTYTMLNCSLFKCNFSVVTYVEVYSMFINFPWLNILFWLPSFVTVYFILETFLFLPWSLEIKASWLFNSNSSSWRFTYDVSSMN